MTPMRRSPIPVVLWLTLLAPCFAWAAAPELLDRIVAQVDEAVILWSELNLRVLVELQQEGDQRFTSPEQLAQHRQRALDAMIDEEVVVLKARHDSVEIDVGEVEDFLNAEMDRIKSTMSDGEFEEMLERTGLSQRQLKSRYRKQIRHRMLYDRYMTTLAYRSFISRRDIDAYREAHADSLPPKISLSQINIKVTPREEVLEAGMDRIGNIQRMLEAGEDFADVARRLSEDLRTAPDGGDLGCFEHGLLMRSFEDAAFELKPGEISEPVLTEHGYHLILLHEKREVELCASHILVRVRTTQDDKERAMEQVRELRDRALAGEEFSQLARQYSDDSATAQKGGLWIIRDTDSIEPFLLPHIGHLRLGEISQPFLDEGGARILKVNDDMNTLESFVREDRLQDLMRKVIDEFKQEIHIEERLDEEYLWSPLDTPDQARSADEDDPRS